jgi:hypothetical protein
MDQKTNVPGIYKTDTGALINKDNEALKAYKARKAKEKKFNVLEEEITTLKQDMKEIKQLLMDLVNGTR